MAPAQSRQTRRTSAALVGGAGAGLAAMGGLVRSEAFALPGAPRSRPAEASQQIQAAPVRGSVPAARGGAAGVPAVALGCIAFAAVRAGAGQKRSAQAAAAAVDEAPAPFNPAEQVGAMAPLGFFDPLGFAKVGDEAGFRHLRAAELKHGRVAMMASIGALAQHFVRFPFADSARGTFGAVLVEEAQLGIPLLLLVAAMLEGAWREDAAREPGNFGDPMGLNMYSEEMRSKELNNGRMAMLSVLGIFAAEMATGKDAVEQLGF